MLSKDQIENSLNEGRRFYRAGWQPWEACDPSYSPHAIIGFLHEMQKDQAMLIIKSAKIISTMAHEHKELKDKVRNLELELDRLRDEEP